MSVSELPSVGLGKKLGRLRSSLSSVIKGKPEVIDYMIAALISGGSILLEDVPGVGKTTLAKALAASVDLEFRRVQCTPDLLPADIFGFSVYNPREGTFTFRSGPIFCNVLLLDEINRASPRTQSALLEAMAEKQVTVEGTHYTLNPPFMVVATQNPAGYRGTFPLPESQLDRFLFQISLGYPEAEAELEMLFDQVGGHPVHHVSPVLSKDDVLHCQEQVQQVRVEKSVAAYMVEIVRRTRNDAQLRLGCSPRGSLMLFRAAQAFATLEDRNYVIPDDVQRVAPLVLQHRVVATRSGEMNFQAHREIIVRLLSEVKIPV
jgi:MoxR-like ATPase